MLPELQLRRTRLVCALVLSALLVALTTPLCAQSLVGASQPVIRSRGVEGFGPDGQLVGGLGFAFDGKLDNYFLARGRLGALYATSPWILNLGMTVEVGALAGLGWGGELEMSRAGTFFGSAGFARVDDSRWLMHAGVGFAVFGLEWQHVFGGPDPHNALLFEVRVPLGLWWLQKRQEKAEAQTAAPVQAPTIKRPTTPQIKQRITAPPARSPAGAPAASVGDDQSTHAAAAEAALARDEEYASRLAEAQAARAKGERLAEAFALSRAYALRPEPKVALQLADAELALGKPRSALADWQRVGDVTRLPEPERARAKQFEQQLTAALAHLRLELSAALSPQDVVWIDGAVEPIATQGYDVPLDPGAHTVQLRRGERVLVERTFEAQAGSLLRLELEVPPP
jgi:hypothetical protein